VQETRPVRKIGECSLPNPWPDEPASNAHGAPRSMKTARVGRLVLDTHGEVRMLTTATRPRPRRTGRP
jgi:hypothetical protein